MQDYPCTTAIKNNINRGGEKIGAEEVEGLTARHPDVADCRVVAMPDRMFGEKACAFLVMRDALDVRSLGEFLQQQGIAKSKLPERVEGFPLTRVGKARMRATIAEMLAAEEAQAQWHAQPRARKGTAAPCTLVDDWLTCDTIARRPETIMRVLPDDGSFRASGIASVSAATERSRRGSTDWCNHRQVRQTLRVLAP